MSGFLIRDKHVKILIFSVVFINKKKVKTCFDHSSKISYISRGRFDFSLQELDELMQKQFLLVELATIRAWNVEGRSNLFSFCFSYIESL